MKQHHTLELYSANCPLCKHIAEDIQIGKCAGCNQTIYDVNNMTDEIKGKMKGYDVKAVPTTIIDGKIKVVGRHLYTTRKWPMPRRSSVRR
jgi:hypothetical protein